MIRRDIKTVFQRIRHYWDNLETWLASLVLCGMKNNLRPRRGTTPGFE